MTEPSCETGVKTAMSDDAIQRHAMRRSSARLAAVQALYQIELTGVAIDKVILEFHVYRRGGVLDNQESDVPDKQALETDLAKFEAILRGVDDRKSAIDAYISASLSKGWTLERLGAVLKSVLRAACFELAAAPNVPAKVVINEYVDLTRAFFEGKESGFVNGILDHLARTLREPEMEKAKGE